MGIKTGFRTLDLPKMPLEAGVREPSRRSVARANTPVPACHNESGALNSELRYLRDAERKTLLPRGSRANLSPVLRGAARGDPGLSQRLRLPAAGSRCSPQHWGQIR